MIADLASVPTPLLPFSVATFGEGPDVVYLHDVLFDLVSPDGEVPQFLDLLAAEHTVHAVALPGFRDLRELPAVEDLDDYVLALSDLLSALSLERPHLVGTGLGGWLAAELAVHRPESLATLTLVNAYGLGLESQPISRFFDAAAPNPLGGRREIRELLFADPDGPVAQSNLPDFPDDDVNERFFAHIHAAARIGWSPPAFYDPKLLSRLGRVRVPTHVVWGEENAVAGMGHARAYESGIDDSSLTTISGAGQSIVIEQPEALAKAVASFIDHHDT